MIEKISKWVCLVLVAAMILMGVFYLKDYRLFEAERKVFEVEMKARRLAIVVTQLNRIMKPEIQHQLNRILVDEGFPELVLIIPEKIKDEKENTEKDQTIP